MSIKTPLLSAVFLLFSLPALAAPPADVAPDRVVASSFGFDAVDAAPCLQAAIDSGAKTVVVDRRDVPWILGKTVDLRSNVELVLEEGAEIVAQKGAFRKKDSVLLRVRQVENVAIRGLGKGAAVRMRKRDYWAEPYEKSEWRHAIAVTSSKNVRVENLTIAESGGDGIYLGVFNGEPCRDVVIRKVDCVENNRQGISVISVDGLLMEDCVLRDTNGTAPEAGIDFEPNHPAEQISRVVMRRVVSKNNAGDGFAFYLPNMEARGAELTVKMEDCQALDNSRAAFSFYAPNGPGRTLPGEIVVQNCEFSRNLQGVAVRAKSSKGSPMIFRNVKLTTPDAAAAPPANADGAGITLVSVGDDAEPIGAIAFENVEIIDGAKGNLSRLFTIRDASSECLGVADVTGTVALVGAGERQIIELTPEKIAEIVPSLAIRRVPGFDLTTLNGPAEATGAEILAARAEFEKSSVERRPLRARGSCVAWFYAKAGEATRFDLRQVAVGKNALNPGRVVATSPSGAKVELPETAPSPEPQTIEWTATETGWQTIQVSNAPNSFELVGASRPIFTAARPNLNLIGTTGEFFFYVPEGAQDLGIRIVGSIAERVTATLFSPDGAEVFRAENIDSLAAWNIEEGERPALGVWKLRFERPSEGVLEDFVATIFGVPALMW